MKLIPKLFLGLAVPAAIVFAGGWLHLRRTSHLLRESIIASGNVQAVAAISAVDETLHQYLRQWQGFVSGPAVQAALADSEQRYPQAIDPEAWIDSVDAAWANPSDDETRAAIDSVLNHPLAREMHARACLADESMALNVFGEVFLSDRRGANIAQTGMTTDFRQNDEEWWTRARDHGAFIGDIDWDDSLNDYGVPLSIRVGSPSGEFLGVIKIVLRTSSLVHFFDSLTPVHSVWGAAQLSLVTRDGAIIRAGARTQGLDKGWLVGVVEQAANAPPGVAVNSIVSTPSGDRLVLVAGAPVLAGAGWWAAVIEHDAASIFAPVRSLALSTGVGSIAVVLAMALASAGAIVPILRRTSALQRATMRIAAGERGVRVRIRGADEIADLGKSLDHMATELDDVEAQRDAYMAALESTNAEIREQMDARQELEAQLVQAQKLESIGQLAAGIAHEINTPMQYVADNTRFLNDAFTSVLTALNSYVDVLNPTNGDKTWEERLRDVDEIAERCDLYFLREEIPKALEQSIEGIDRIATIVRAMKSFSHPGAEAKQLADINNAIESTIIVCRHRWKYVADVQLDLLPDLPNVPCHLGEFNQVILNLVVNAADAIADVVGDSGQSRGIIRISTRRDGEHAVIRVSDTGGGIPADIRNRIFDPFFTTKGVGKGTGQGLAICHNTIVVRHDGEVSFETEPGTGTTFILKLPLADTARAATTAKDAA